VSVVPGNGNRTCAGYRLRAYNSEDCVTGGSRELAPFPVTVTGPPFVTILRPTLPEMLAVPDPSRPPPALNRGVTLRGAVLAPGQRLTVAHPGTEGAEDVRFLPAPAELPRGTFSLRG